MIILDPSVLSGLQAARVVDQAYKLFVKNNQGTSMTDFCRRCGISRATLFRWRKGGATSHQGLMSLVLALETVGMEYRVQIS